MGKNMFNQNFISFSFPPIWISLNSLYIPSNLNLGSWFRVFLRFMIEFQSDSIKFREEYDAYFYKVFRVYTQVWKMQQENRQKLVESGLRRSEIGEIASRIAQLYFGHYMRTSQASYLHEAFVFYDAVLSRDYFNSKVDAGDLPLATKQLRLISRFLTVCLLLNRNQMVHQLLNQLRVLLDDCKRTFPVCFFSPSFFFIAIGFLFSGLI